MPLPPESIIRARLAKAQEKASLTKASEAKSDPEPVVLLNPDEILLSLNAVSSIADAEASPKVDSVADR